MRRRWNFKRMAMQTCSSSYSLRALCVALFVFLALGAGCGDSQNAVTTDTGGTGDGSGADVDDDVDRDGIDGDADAGDGSDTDDGGVDVSDTDEFDGSGDTGPLLEDGEICEADRECESRICLRADVGGTQGVCTSYCFDTEDCEEGTSCVFFVNSGGDAIRVCVPDDLCIDGDDDQFGLGAGCLGGDCDDSDPDINPAAPELCDSIDNDCDGLVDDRVVGAGDECDTGFVGVCAIGVQTCVGGTPICESARAASDEVCDGLDNDCDGETDEDVDGDPLVQACYGGPEGTEDVGQCVGGNRVCEDGTWGACIDQVLPFPEICDELDNDCDGETDEDAIGGTIRCDTGLPGICASGFAGCGEDAECFPTNEPSPEVCDGLDSDCDGLTDEDDDDEPIERDCYDADPATRGVGVCVGGIQTCLGGDFGSCQGDVTPSIELCDGLDNDCDGEVDNDAVGGGASCSTGQPGICALGFASCDEGGAACVPVLEPAEEVCDGLDNDCDGLVDEGPDGEPLARSCYSGAPETRDVGICVGGVEACVAGGWSACVGQVLPGFESCDGLDNDCDGVADEGAPGSGNRCDTGADGVCAEGTTECVDGDVICTPNETASEEVCDGEDNDCDGAIDEDADGEILSRECFDDDPAFIGIGTCTTGIETCEGADGYGTCLGDVVPTVEVCDGLDNDCDGATDDGAVGGGSCATGEPGVCATGVFSCDEGGVTGCVPLFDPSDETCDGIDNDCDGATDEDLDGSSLQRDCYTGPAGSNGLGVCHGGQETCFIGSWSACAGQTLPTLEVCDGLDNDCDGAEDDGNPDGGTPCNTGEPGICSRGSTVCGTSGEVECAVTVSPVAETCDGLDNDCDGEADEAAPGVPLSRACYTGPAGTLDVGVCHGGAETCVSGGYASCTDQVVPGVEVCDGLDNDCDGIEDDGNPGSGLECETGRPGICSRGTTQCQDGGTICVSVLEPQVEVCDGIDNDCDGLVDEDLGGDPLTRDCYTGADGTEDVGLCHGGTETCVAGGWSACADQVVPSFEVCDGDDNDCDGTPDDGNPNGGIACTTDEPGICAAGLTECSDGAVICVSTSAPEPEVCDARDNDCDGLVDEQVDGSALQRGCYTGPDGTEDIGLCHGGIETCDRGSWGACADQVIPTFETCDLLDNDCDGTPDDGDPGGGIACNTGEPGICTNGTTACSGGDVVCERNSEPQPEVCDGRDNDCDGLIDEDDLGDPLTRSCYTGPAGTLDVGICVAGIATCSEGGFGACEDQVTPGVEVCDGIDNDCDGIADDGNPGGDAGCNTGEFGVCAPGTTVCTGGAIDCVRNTEPSDEVCDARDNDCDGSTDEDIVGDPLTRSCYTADPATLDVGICSAGTETCEVGAWGSCDGQVTPGLEICDGIDNDCDGLGDDGDPGGGIACTTDQPGICAVGTTACLGGAIDCVPNTDPQLEVCDARDNDCDGLTDEDEFGADLTRHCYTGPLGTEDVGICVGGTETCSSGTFGSCTGQTIPGFEVCDGIDNDCDGVADDGNPEGGIACNTGEPGICASGLTECSGGDVVCVANSDPQPEVCDGRDNDCDGLIDEDLAGDPLTRACYTGPDGTEDVGICVGGFETCSDGVFGSCTGQVVPGLEVCDGIDNDCDGAADDGNPGGDEGCNTGEFGVCAPGTTVCTGGAIDCVRNTEPSAELCDARDNDCDGFTDEDLGGDPLTRSCYTADPATQDVGICSAGTETCEVGAWGSCTGQTIPGFETCDGIDNDCDGLADDGDPGGGIACTTDQPGICAVGTTACLGGAVDCVPNSDPQPEVCDARDNDCDGLTDEDEFGADLTRHCYTGPGGTEDVGICVGGTETCSSGTFGSCTGQTIPGFEVCDGIDNDCDGVADDGNPEGGIACNTGEPGICASGLTECSGGDVVCVANNTATAEVCDNLDNDCDGLIDEDLAGDPLARACYTGPDGTLDVGICVGGTETCDAGNWGSCTGQTIPGFEVCDGIDNDCDGVADDGNPEGGIACNTGDPGICAAGLTECSGGDVVCTPNLTATTEVCDNLDNDCDGFTDEDLAGDPLARACYTGPDGTLDVGICVGGTETCDAGNWGSCTGQTIPGFEVCDGIDNDCDGVADDGNPEGGIACNTGDPGICAAGLTECSGGDVVCTANQTATTEICDALDNDCDGFTDEDLAGDPLARACYTGPDGTAGVGICEAGTETCDTGTWGSCTGQTIPGFEVCDGVDNDCDGITDDGNPEGGIACNTGIPGICASGLTQCSGGGVVCTANQTATTEICDALDNDCDGLTDEDALGDPLARSCYTGPDGTAGVGICATGTATCSLGSYGSCAGQTIPGFEVCDGLDNDCDGAADDGNPEGGIACNTGDPGVCASGLTQCSGGDVACVALETSSTEVCDARDNDCDGLTDEDAGGDPLARSCYSGPVGTAGVGACVAGTETCGSGTYGSCNGQVTPTGEICDGIDNDCDGFTDEGNPGGGTACSTGEPGICSVGTTQCSGGGIVCQPNNTAQPEVCDGVDNDCDGLVDEDEFDTALTRACYSGAPETLDIGLCHAGTETCIGGGWTSCTDQVIPTFETCDTLDNDCDGVPDDGNPGGGTSCNTGDPGICAGGVTSCSGGDIVCNAINSSEPEICDGFDNDCDGLTDEDGLGDDLTRTCYSGPDGTQDVGICVAGTETCTGGAWASCTGQTIPAFETCNGIDDDCDGVPDDGNPEGGIACNTGELGICAAGTTLCSGGTVDCVPNNTADTEVCDGVDNDCDGLIDEDDFGDPMTRGCYGGPGGTEDVGICVGGTETCVGGGWTSCVGQVLPAFETCDNQDNDCDGAADEDDPEGGIACDTGDLGVCALGVTRCDAVDGVVCDALNVASVEVCDGLDNDCDGLIDEDIVGDPMTRTCYSGAEGTAGVGLCTEGVETCTAGEWTSCVGQVVPSFEICDTFDNDCDGFADEDNPEGGFACDTGLLGICGNGQTNCSGGVLSCDQLFTSTAELCDGFDNDCDGEADEESPGVPLTRACYDGPDGTEGVGNCIGGTATCQFGDYGGCTGQIIPVTEVCDFEDNDCDGDIDEGAQLSFYVDADFDGYGDPDTEVLACAGPGYVTNGLDCYDLNAFANPDQEGFFPTDRGDGSFDYNCDGLETDFFPDTVYGTCSSDPPFCYLIEEGWDAAAGLPPECGLEGTYIFDCIGNGNNCDPTTALTTQKCH